jgi:2-phospho-L-lactate transferase/gluconeogenesis factor (CofD/UPF0052 family)
MDCPRFVGIGGGTDLAGRWESQISAAGKAIERVWLDPKNGPPTAGVLEVIGSADVILPASGSLFTSLVPNLLVASVAEKNPPIERDKDFGL